MNKQDLLKIVQDLPPEMAMNYIANARAEAMSGDMPTKTNARFEYDITDGLVALKRVMAREYGVKRGQTYEVQTLFGAQKRETDEYEVQVGPGQTETVSFGSMPLPWGGTVVTGVTGTEFGPGLMLTVGHVVRDKGKALEFLALVQKQLENHSIYRGKALSLHVEINPFTEEESMSAKFLDFSGFDESKVIYNDETETAIQRDLMSPIVNARKLLDMGESLKTGVLLTGTYGTGKTLAATRAAKAAVQHGVTYLYLHDATWFPMALRFARRYQSPAAVLFVEDIDRETSGDRSAALDDILNTLDGVESKSTNVITVVTTNDLHGINPAMLRAGRLDSIIQVGLPGVEATVALLRAYGGDLIDPLSALRPFAQRLVANKTIPASIAEVIRRAKRMRALVGGTGYLTDAQLSSAVDSVQYQGLVLQEAIVRDAERKKDKVTLDSLLRTLVEEAAEKASL